MKKEGGTKIVYVNKICSWKLCAVHKMFNETESSVI